MFLALCAGATCFWWMAPRAWLRTDHHLALARLVTLPGEPHASAQTFASHRFSQQSASLAELAATCRTTARSLRAGSVVGVALAQALAHHCSHSSVMRQLASNLDAAMPLHSALATALDARAADVHEERCLSLLLAATVDMSLSPVALERAATVLDDIAARRADVRIAAAHASLTVRFLTALPVGVVTVALLVSPSLRTSWTHPVVLVPALAGVTLHAIGRKIVRRIVAGVVATADEPPGAASRIADTVVSGLAAGLTPAAACARLDSDPGCGADATVVADAVRKGVPLADALSPFAKSPETSAIADALLAASRDGTGGLDAATQLADISRLQRGERTRAAVAALPARLAVPVTVFVLPSFLLGVLVPVVATGARLS